MSSEHNMGWHFTSPSGLFVLVEIEYFISKRHQFSEYFAAFLRQEMNIFRSFARDCSSKFLLLQIDCIALECWKYGNGHNFTPFLSRLLKLACNFPYSAGFPGGSRITPEGVTCDVLEPLGWLITSKDRQAKSKDLLIALDCACQNSKMARQSSPAQVDPGNILVRQSNQNIYPKIVIENCFLN